MDRLNAMEIFIRVAELASFTKAAESLGLPKGSISSAVQNLESHLGSRLLHRTTRKVVLTQDGEVFYERCKDVLADMDELESMFQTGEHSIQGRIRIDLPLALSRDFIVPHLPEFIRQHPGIRIELSSTDRKVDLIAEGFDCVIRVGNLTESGLIARNMGYLSMVNCASPDYIARYGMPSSMDDLQHHYLVNYAQTLGSTDAAWEYLDGKEVRSIKMPSLITVNNSDAYSHACLAGLGVIQVPLAGARRYIASGAMIAIMPDHRSAPMPVSLLYPNRRNQPQRIKVLMAWLTERLQDYIA
ncbi:LysR family transcriptional regulator [Methylobacillus gramineus]|uniref:LysR family transcriptional regulator n=1 Tax=Methylobacillus gramineus TaxID=755169 RepID=UPI001CFFF196|nr:LysR family transcriptional regulator [Methylobacillus gramineus]MCB5185869.1 LysR family transcriptional regulator [Methylobacillus gramineus]